MADIITNTLQIGSNNLILRDADAQEQLVTVKDGLTAVEAQLEQTTADMLNAYVTDTASGSIASFPDGADGVPVKSLTVDIEPVQSGSGDPSPTNIRPISGRTSAVVTRAGVNVWNEEWEAGDISSSTGENVSSTTNIRSKNYIPISPNTEYYDVCKSFSNADIRSRFYDADKNYIGFREKDGSGVQLNDVFTTPENAYYLRFAMQSGYGTTYKNDISINYPSTDHDYHAYDGQTVTIDLDGTRYGGTLDVTTGKMTVDRGYYTDDGTGAWQYLEDGASSRYYLGSAVSGAKNASTNGKSNYGNLVSSFNQNGIFVGSNGRINICGTVKDAFASVDALKSALASNPIQIAYELAEPFEVTLTPQEVKTLLGTNNIWADAGDVEVEYRADTKLYIQKVLNA